MENSNPNSSLQDALRAFFQNNPSAKLTHEANATFVHNPWDDDSIKINILSDKDPLIAALNSIILPKQLHAIYHIDNNCLEVIYTYVKSDDPAIDRRFDISIDGKSFECEFSSPSPQLLALAKHVQRAPSTFRSDMRLLTPFRDAQNLESPPASAKTWFSTRTPICFHIKGVNRTEVENPETLVRHINFGLKYYDRRSPVIEIVPDRNLTLSGNKQVVRAQFPDSISLPRIDPFFLNLLHEASRETPRFAILYYYQILEYAAFYYVDDKAKDR